MNETVNVNVNVNKEYKDSVFSLLFSDPDVLRELYSAIEGVELPPDISIDINTLSNVLIREQINDISFTIGDRLVVLIEHQSTINNNMPLRLLMYVAKVYEKIIDHRKIYRTKLEKIPRPEFIVLYNGTAPYPDHKELRLSEAFKDAEDLKLNAELPLELVVQVYNINRGHNTGILRKCEILDNYSFFVDKIREYQKMNFKLAKAVSTAIKYCIENNKLKDFLETHSSEVQNMLITAEYDPKEEMEALREEAWEYGLEEGIERGKMADARNALSKGIPVETVQEITGLDMETIKNIQTDTQGK
jgi:predicted transposase/invertase (TIGR01784 family)